MTDLTKILCYENFDKYPEGSLRQVEGFQSCNNGTIETASGGGKTVNTWIARGDEGYTRWGYTYHHHEIRECEAGDEIWFRLYTKFDNDFKIQSTPGWLKGFRIGRVKKSDNSNRGYVDWYVHNDPNNYWKHVVEFEPKAPVDDFWEDRAGSTLHKGQWQMYEVYVYLHPVNGKMRMWCDGKLVTQQTRPTIAGPSNESKVSRLLWTTYYNGSAPATQGMDFDHHTVAVKNKNRDDTKYMDTDAHGNKFIGLDIANGAIVPPPVEPPTEPPVEPPIEPPPVLPPIDPEIPEPPPEFGSGSTMHIDENAIYVSSDLPVVVLRSDGTERMV